MSFYRIERLHSDVFLYKGRGGRAEGVGVGQENFADEAASSQGAGDRTTDTWIEKYKRKNSRRNEDTKKCEIMPPIPAIQIPKAWRFSIRIAR